MYMPVRVHIYKYACKCTYIQKVYNYLCTKIYKIICIRCIYLYIYNVYYLSMYIYIYICIYLSAFVYIYVNIHGLVISLGSAMTSIVNTKYVRMIKTAAHALSNNCVLLL